MYSHLKLRKDADAEKEKLASFATILQGRQPRIMIMVRTDDRSAVVTSGYADCGFDGDMGPVVPDAEGCPSSFPFVMGVLLWPWSQAMVPRIYRELKTRS